LRLRVVAGFAVGMFYHVAKIVWFFLEPSNLLAFVTLVGVFLLFTRYHRAGRRLAVLGIALIAITGLTPLANWLILPLETRFPIPDLAGRKVDGIIVLGGAVQERQTVANGIMTMNDASERVVAMADLARRFPEATVIFAGGAGIYSRAPKPEAEVLRDNLGTLGLAPGRVIFETESVDTYENAVLAKRMRAPKPGETWLLVTSAWHMPRSVGIFRRVDWPVIAYPVDHRTAGWQDATRGFSSVSDGLRRADVAMREWLGLIVYRMTGRSSALLPSP
jgi:uncharacterized SAM-binding protein YcdF (DUF218 family)